MDKTTKNPILDHVSTSYEVNNLIATWSFLIFAGCIALFSAKKPTKPVCYILFASLIMFAASFCLCLWYRIRDAHRRLILKNEHDKSVCKWAEKIGALAENVLIPHVTNVISEKKKHGLEVDKGKIVDNSCADVVRVYLDSMTREMDENHKKLYLSRLEEPNSLFKNWVDQIARKFRYYVFFIGLSSLLSALAIHFLM